MHALIAKRGFWHLYTSYHFFSLCRIIISCICFSAPPYKRSRELTINNSLKYSQYTYRRARVSSSAIYTPPPKTNALFKLLFLQIYITALAPLNFRNKKKYAKGISNGTLKKRSASTLFTFSSTAIFTRCYEKCVLGWWRRSTASNDPPRFSLRSWCERTL